MFFIIKFVLIRLLIQATILIIQIIPIQYILLIIQAQVIAQTQQLIAQV
jgi:hypothetical protein